LSGTEHKQEARRWLRFASEDLTSARTLAEAAKAPPRQSCWLAQQAAEKALKALLVWHQIDFPRTHDLDLLRNLLPADCAAKARPEDVAELTEWAVEARYPGDWPEASLADAEKAIATAAELVEAVRQEIAPDSTV